MPRTTIPVTEMEQLGAGNWLSLYRLQTAVPHPVEITARNNGRFYAAKCLLLSTSYAHEPITVTETAGFCQTLYRIGLENISVLLLAADRPITYFEGLDFTENYQLEIPGGVAEANESQRHAGLREAVEEGGLSNGVENLIQSTSLLACPCPWDAGSHVEVYSIETALVHGEPNPPPKEGVDPTKCVRIPLMEALQYLLDRRAEGVCVEGYALSALWALSNALHGGWKEFTFHEMLRNAGLYLKEGDDIQELVGRRVCYQYWWHESDDQALRNFSGEWEVEIAGVELDGGIVRLFPSEKTGLLDRIEIYRIDRRICVSHRGPTGVPPRGLMERYGRVIDTRMY